MRYVVMVGNIGKVYEGSEKKTAMETYRKYKRQSRDKVGRAADEEVVLIEQDKYSEIIESYKPH